ncbi:MAG: hypothetical protein PHD46_06425 [Eubacteriales bacterium]|nr:hypothetical protein [Eubacteriales bacterium]
MAEFAEVALFGLGYVLKIGLELAANPKADEFRFLLVLDRTRGVKIQFELLHKDIPPLNAKTPVLLSEPVAYMTGYGALHQL